MLRTRWSSRGPRTAGRGGSLTALANSHRASCWATISLGVPDAGLPRKAARSRSDHRIGVADPNAALPVADRLVRDDEGADAADERERCESGDRGRGGDEGEQQDG